MWNIIGQKKALSLLKRSIEIGSVSHAYLFIGPEHSGKMTLAVELAKALNCDGHDIPCNECDSCRKIGESKHADILVIGLNQDDGSGESKNRTEISIEQIRQIQHGANLPPFEGKYKVFIIESAESLSIEAANALLKTLEEPESKVVFILLTTDSALLPETVVSRCQPVELVPVPVREIEDALTAKFGIEQDRAALLARLSRGWFGWAVTAAGEENMLEQRAEMLDRILDAIDADLEDRFTYSTQLATRFTSDRSFVYERLNLWLDWWRDLLLIKADMVDNVTNINRLDELKEISKGWNLKQIRDFIQSIQSAADQLRRNANPRLVLEVMMIDMPVTGNTKEKTAGKMR